MTIWIIIFVTGVLTFASRLSFIELFGTIEMPEGLRRFLRFVPATVLPALVFPAVLAPGGEYHIAPGNERIWAILVALAVAWKTRNMLLTIIAGMAALWTLQAVM